MWKQLKKGEEKELDEVGRVRVICTQIDKVIKLIEAISWSKEVN